VEEKLAALVKKEFDASGASKWQPAGKAPEIAPKASARPAFAFDMEEIGDEPSPAEPEQAATADAVPPTDEPPAGAPDAPPVANQIRGAFRRFLSELPGGEANEAAPPQPQAASDAAPAPEVKADAPATTQVTPEPAPPQQAAEPAIVPEVEAEAEVEAEPVVEAEPQVEAEASVEPSVEPEVEPELQAESASEPELEVTPDAAPDEAMSESTFQGRVLDLIEEVVQQPLATATAAPEAEAPGPDEKPVRTSGVAESAQRLLASPLFRELGEAELLAVVRGMHLHTFEAGDIAITEGEPGESLFIVTSGSVRMFVRNPAGHNFEMGVLREGDFFGELSSLSGRPRGSTVVAMGHTELLELAKKTVDQIARTHPRVRETLESTYIQRASSPEAAAIRAVPVDPGSHKRAIEVLEAYFGESRWDPRMRLRLADLLVQAGKEDDAVPLLVGLADDLDRAGYPEKAIAILKKIEKLRKRGTQEVNLAPLKKKPAAAAPSAVAKPTDAKKAAADKSGKRGQTVDSFASWMVDVVRDAVAPAAADSPLPPTLAPGYAKGLLASPLFEGLTEDELLTMIRELRLLSFDAGDIIITEGEPGQSLFILTAGLVKVSVRNAQGRNVKVTELRAGSFFGEMATVSGKPRTASVTAGQRCELLELDKQAIDQVAARHPRVREVLEEIYISRATSPETARARAGAGATPA
jgi:CRP-like cAMP-binding protein